MKIVTSLVLTLFILNLLNAQIIPPHYISGGFGFFSNNRSNEQNSNYKYNSNTINFNTNFSWAKSFKGKYLLGAFVRVSGYRQKETQSANMVTINNISNDNEYSLGPLIRRYYPISENWMFFWHGYLQGSYIKSKIRDDIGTLTSIDSWGLGASFGLGINYALSRKWMVEVRALSVNFDHSVTPRNSYNQVKREQNSFSLQGFTNDFSISALYIY
jgi:hypothetical protein